MRKFIIGAVSVFLAVVSINASASVVSTDWQVSGDNLVTQDTTSGLEWLSFTQTINTSRDYVLSQLSSGGQYDGWRYATDNEVVDLWTNFGFDLSINQSPTVGVASAGLISAANLLGNTSNLLNSSIYDYGAIGVTANLVGIDQYNVMGAWHYLVDNSTYYATVVSPNYVLTDSLTPAGHYLVRTSVVPVPAAVWLFGSGLIGIIGIARRKKV